jgi:hypothetical protein
MVVFVLLFSFSIVFSGGLPPENTILKLHNNTKATPRKHNTEAEL